MNLESKLNVAKDQEKTRAIQEKGAEVKLQSSSEITKTDECDRLDSIRSEEVPESVEQLATVFDCTLGNNCLADRPTKERQVHKEANNNTKPHWCGLRNLGNTCYINSCVQALYASNKLRQHILSTEANTGTLNFLFAQLFRQMDQAGSIEKPDYYPEIKPDVFVDEFRVLKPQFIKHEQHDAQEFLSILLECIHQETNHASKKRLTGSDLEMKSAQEAWDNYITHIDDSFYSKLFVGQLESCLKCLTCHHTSISWDCFWQLPLHLTENSNTLEDNLVTSEQASDSLSIESCLKEYTSSEILSGDCSPFCEHCGQRQDSSKQQIICRVPHYLIVHLKRFTYTGAKITRKVVVTPVLQLCNKTFYLYACVLHRGSETLGHYFTLVHNSQKWLLFDDENIICNIAQEHIDNILQDYAYICFYKSIITKSQTSAQ